MRNQILYASMIFTISALLVSTAMYTADASGGNSNHTVIEDIKGNGAGKVFGAGADKRMRNPKA